MKSVSNDKYPAPRFPRFMVEKATPEKLLSIARRIVRETGGRNYMGVLEKGDTVHVLFRYGQDMMVFEAIKEALTEKGVTAEIVHNYELIGMSKEEYETKMKPGGELREALNQGAMGWKEPFQFRPGALVDKGLLPESLKKEGTLPIPLNEEYTAGIYLEEFMGKHPEIKNLLGGPGGGKYYWGQVYCRSHADRFLGNWVYVLQSHMLNKAGVFPSELHKLIETKTTALRARVCQGRVTDPEGTDITWTMTPEQAELWSNAEPHKMAGEGTDLACNHLFMYPDGARVTNMSGVIAGCSNHTGYFPYIELHIDNGMVQRAEGGGKYGEIVRSVIYHPKLSQYSEYKYPTAPYPGHWYVSQDGFGTNPKYVRLVEPMIQGTAWLPNVDERNRAGAIHWGFGFEGFDQEDVEYAEKNGMPNRHCWHVHNFFVTIKLQLRDTKEWVTVAS